LLIVRVSDFRFEKDWASFEGLLGGGRSVTNNGAVPFQTKSPALEEKEGTDRKVYVHGGSSIVKQFFSASKGVVKAQG